MYPSDIARIVSPRTIADALQELDPVEDAVFLAGGMSLMQAVKSRLIKPDIVVNLNEIEELAGIRSEESGLFIGACTRYVDVAQLVSTTISLAALSDAAKCVGDRQVRNRGTLGGSLCWNYHSACCPCASLVLDAQLTLSSLSESGQRVDRNVAISEFLTGVLETARRPEELLTSIFFPRPAHRSGSAYKKWGLQTDALPVVGVAAAVTLDARGAVISARLAMTGLMNGTQRYPEAEAALVGSRDAGESVAAIDLLKERALVHSDGSASAEYRKHLIGRLARQVIDHAFARATEQD